MGVDAGVTIYFYTNGKLIKISHMDCYKFQSNCKDFNVTDFDCIKVKFSSEYDSSSESVSEEDESDG